MTIYCGRWLKTVPIPLVLILRPTPLMSTPTRVLNAVRDKYYIHKRVHDDINVIAMMSSCALGIHHALKHKQFQCYTH